MTPRPHRSARGMTLIEVMIAGAVLLVAMLGFVVTSGYAATSTAVAHRRTMTTFLRGELMDRLAVTPRLTLGTLAGYTTDPASPQFVVDSCYDVDGRLLSRNAGYASSSYSCGAGTTYQSHVAASAGANATWTVHLYVERADPGCAPAQRYSSLACSPADLRLTD